VRGAVVFGSALVGIVLGLLLWGSGYEDMPIPLGGEGDNAKLGAAEKRLQAKLQRFVPREPFIVVDAAHNRLYLRDGEALKLDAMCSSGSGMILKDIGGERHWVFDTPRGHFRILNIMRNPIWKKPDWAFVEEGKPIPKDPNERFEAGVLGEYGMYFGDGYLIHGTLYERLLGRSVTHGCIRLGREDLRQLHELVRVGTPVYIY
jgi:L,D-transpeptidase ErfK/SrfK